MPSFDVVSEIDQQEIRNAVDQAHREVATRYDFKGTGTTIELGADEIKLHSSSEDRLAALRQVLEEKLVKRKVSLKALDYQKVEEASGATARQVVKLVAGISKEKATELNKHIKGLSLKGVQSQVQGEQLRVTGKKRDDLQAVIAALKDHDFGIPLQFSNFRDLSRRAPSSGRRLPIGGLPELPAGGAQPSSCWRPSSGRRASAVLGVPRPRRPPWGALAGARAGPQSRRFAVAGVDVDAGDTFAVEHVDVPAIVLEGEPQVEAEVAKLAHGVLLEVPRHAVVAPLPHHEEVPPQGVALEPAEGVALDADRSGGEQHDPEVGLEEVQELRDLLDQRILARRLEEGVPVCAAVGSRRCWRPDASDSTPSMSNTTGRVHRALPPPPVLWVGAAHGDGIA